VTTLSHRILLQKSNKKWFLALGNSRQAENQLKTLEEIAHRLKTG
jgi:hypothetical protein